MKDVGASVRQRLLDRSKAEGRPFQELLQYFAMERFLYRLAQSPFSERFILKGALLMTAWRAPLSRPTMDIDLCGRTSNRLDRIVPAIGAMCDIAVEPGGIEYHRNSIEASRIREYAEYAGVRVRFNATLARARVPMQIDIGFGDVVVPSPEKVEYPTLLELPPPVLITYPKETVVAEKLQAITALGLLNSRLEDYYDIALLSRLYEFEQRSLVEAIVATFGNRGTAVDPNPAGLTAEYACDPARASQWKAFVRRGRLAGAHGTLAEVVADVRRFALPALSAASGRARAA